MYTIACTSSAQNHPKISCSEDRFLSFRSGIFSETIPAELGVIISGEQAQKPLANMYTIACASSAQNHPKISCSEGRFLLSRSGIFSETIPAELGVILSCEQAQKSLANMYTIACGFSAFAHPKISCSEDRFLSFRSGIPNRNKKQASFRVGIPHKQFEYALYDLGRVYTDDLHKPSSMHSLI